MLPEVGVCVCLSVCVHFRLSVCLSMSVTSVHTSMCPSRGTQHKEHIVVCVKEYQCCWRVGGGMHLQALFSIVSAAQACSPPLEVIQRQAVVHIEKEIL